MIPPTDLRLFVAIELETELREAVANALAELRRAVSGRLKAAGGRGNPLKWVAPENLHVTLKFLGETPQHVLPYVEEALAQAAAEAGPTRIAASGSGAFPTTGKPRVLWIGLEIEEKPIRRIVRALDDALAPLGFPRETRPFASHLTIARVRDNTPPEEVRLIGEALQRHRVGALGGQDVSAFALVRSELFPTGPRYTRLAIYPLGAMGAVPVAVFTRQRSAAGPSDLTANA